jgi:hypothetical protein
MAMSGRLKVGDRVRVRTGNANPNGYEDGDVGRVLKVLTSPAGGETRFYVVAIVKDRLVGAGTAFAEGEIEPDV